MKYGECGMGVCEHEVQVWAYVTMKYGCMENVVWAHVNTCMGNVVSAYVNMKYECMENVVMGVCM